MPRRTAQKPEGGGEGVIREDGVIEEADTLKVPTNFRVSKATADKFRKIAADFSNQDAALNAMLGAYQKVEVQKSVPAAYAREIESFQSYLEILLTKYMALMMDYTNVDEKARISVHNLLESKDNAILGLEEDIRRMQSSLKELDEVMKRADDAEVCVKALEAEKVKLTNDIERQRIQYSNIINDKETINQGLRDQIEGLRDQIETLNHQMEDYVGLPKQLQEKEQELKETEYKHQLKIVDMERKTNADMAAMRAAHADEMEALRQKYDSREEKIRLQYDDRINAILKNRQGTGEMEKQE